MNNLTVEFNEKFKKANCDLALPSGGTMMITPPLDEDYWVFRVKLFKEQAIIAFPKFSTIGVGFAQEEDWNTNLPFSTDADKLFDHIRDNKKYDEISDEQCLEAIRLIQAACKIYKNGGAKN